MSRVSISRRLQALFESAERIDPRAAAVHKMKPALRMRYDNWRSECDAITEQMGGGEAVYRSYLDTGTWPLPDTPRAVAEALGIADAGPVLTADTTLQEAADAWAAMIAD